MEENIIYVSKYSLRRRIFEVFFGKKNDNLPLTPYFKYELKVRHHQNNLCFDKEPSRILYENSIFGLLSNFTSISGAINCLKYHFELYEAKDEYLEFFRYELPARIKSSASKSSKIIFEGCLDWVTEQIREYQMEPIYLGSRAELHGTDPEKIMRLFTYLLNDINDPSGSEFAMKGTSLGGAIILHQFSCFKNSALSSLQKDFNTMKSKNNIPLRLHQEMQAFFYGSTSK
jgi:hypothetical protein